VLCQLLPENCVHGHWQNTASATVMGNLFNNDNNHKVHDMCFNMVWLVNGISLHAHTTPAASKHFLGDLWDTLAKLDKSEILSLKWYLHKFNRHGMQHSTLVSITYSLNVTAIDHLSTPVFSESKIRMHGLQHSQHTMCTYTPQPLVTMMYSWQL